MKRRDKMKGDELSSVTPFTLRSRMGAKPSRPSTRSIVASSEVERNKRLDGVRLDVDHRPITRLKTGNSSKSRESRTGGVSGPSLSRRGDLYLRSHDSTRA